MAKHVRTAASLAALALAGFASVYAVPQARPVYTFCEEEDNDFCATPDVIDASVAVASLGGDEDVRDCFYITGKLQEDCVWDIEPKCAIKVYDKPAPCRDSNGNVIPGSFYEPVLRTSLDGGLQNVAVLSDRTVRLGVAAVMDAFDGTINGLNGNGRHGEIGEVTIKVTYDGGDDGQPRGVDQMYVFQFGDSARRDALGSDALRVAFIIPSGVATVDILCCNDTGQESLCYDVDHYLIQNLIPGRAYAVEVIGGLDEDCNKTDTLIGIFDKNCNLQFFDDDGGTDYYSEIIAFAEVDGTLRFAVTGTGDEDFNGLEDSKQQDYYDFLEILDIVEDFQVTYRQGASLKDASAGDVTRYPRTLWDEYNFLDEFYGAPEAYFDHDVCGGYCIKVSLAEHVDPSERPAFNNPNVVNGARVDMNSDGFVNASDLALLLSFWGASVQ